jgi:hypothetical protein
MNTQDNQSTVTDARYFLVGVRPDGERVIRVRGSRTIEDCQGPLLMGPLDKLLSECSEEDLSSAKAFVNEIAFRLHEGATVSVIGGRKHKGEIGTLKTFVTETFGRHTTYRAKVQFEAGTVVIDERWLVVKRSAESFETAEA